MRVRNSNLKETRLNGQGSRAVGRGSGIAPEDSFRTELREAGNRLVVEDLEALIESLESAGERLKKSPVPENLVEYKDLVRSFMLSCVEAIYEVEKKAGFAGAGQRRMFTLVRTIDSELERLTELVLSGQRDEISLVAKIDEIRGLLMDFYY